MRIISGHFQSMTSKKNYNFKSTLRFNSLENVKPGEEKWNLFLLMIVEAIDFEATLSQSVSLATSKGVAAGEHAEGDGVQWL